MTHPQLVPAVLVPLFLWRIYRRLRRNIGRQRFSAGRSIFSVSLVTVVLGLIGWSVARAGFQLWPIGAGLVGGLALAAVGYRLTQFERTTDGEFYTPNAYLGVAVSLLLIGRMMYRILLLTQASAAGFSDAGLAQSPLTLSLFGLTFGYYLGYSALLLFRFRFSTGGVNRV